MSAPNVLAIPDMAAALLAVSGAVSFEEFARGAMGFLRCAFEFDGARIGLDAVKDRPGVFVYAAAEEPDRPGVGDFDRAVPGEFDALSRFLAQSPGVEVFGGQDLPAPLGWRDFVGMAFWREQRLAGCFYAYRSSRQAPFSETDVMIVEQAYAFFSGALNRILVLNEERGRRANLEDSLLDIPIGTVLLRWDFVVEQANRAADRLCMAWIQGIDAVRMMKLPERIEVPAEVLSACAAMKENWSAQAPAKQRELSRIVFHPANSALEAKITLLRPNAVRLGAPSFLVQITEVLRRGGDPRANLEHLMARLTPAERELAQRLATGLTNKEIALQTGKSLQTVKNQMSSILAKLGLPNRATLIAVIRD